jgi:hypothetical protein
MYDIGQILYIISQKQRRVFPVRVVEQVTRKSLDAIREQYWVELPVQNRNDAQSKRCNLDSLGEPGRDVFNTLNEVHKYMLGNAKAMIDSEIVTAQKLAHEKFDAMQEPFTPNPPETVDIDRIQTNIPKQQTSATVTLDDGTVARVTIPEVFDGESSSS